MECSGMTHIIELYKLTWSWLGGHNYYNYIINYNYALAWWSGSFLLSLQFGIKLMGPNVQSALSCNVAAGYNVSYVCDQNSRAPSSYYVDPSKCSGSLCSHAHSVNFAPGSICSISVSSENVTLATAVKHAGIHVVPRLLVHLNW